ncbi:MAG: LysR family transcriptional regulator [Lachnospiraceae bacterium]|nr:LysR family transcriptional regulator [Lachnospiraceae bacterium]
MTERQLEIFVTLAETLNFTRTSEYLFLSQTTVTLQIRNLEEELGVQLFDRTSRSVKLTAAGKTFYDGAVQILQMMRSTADETRLVAKNYTGVLDIGFATEANATGISDIIGSFAQKHHEVRLRILGDYPSNLVESLVKDEYDIILSPAFENINQENLESCVIGRYGLVAAFKEGHRFEGCESVSYEDFEGEKMIYVSAPDIRLDFTSQFIRRLEEKKVHTEVISTIDNIETVLLMLEARMGISVLPEYFAGRFYGTSGIRTCRIDEKLSSVAFSAIWQKGKMTREKSLFIEHLKECVKKY